MVYHGPGGFLLLLLALVTIGPARADGTCDGWRAPVEAGVVSDPELAEISGVVAGRRSSALWVHNDKGDGAKVYALGADGKKLGEVHVTDADNVDWEDIAAGPCDEACSCLYLADSGDNDLSRDVYTVWRLPEPAPVDGDVGDAVALTYVYPGDPAVPHDAEALLVAPDSGEIFLLTKTTDTTEVYAFPDVPPEPGDAPAVLSLVTSLPLENLGADAPDVTGGDVSPGGDRVVLRTPKDVLLFDGPPGGGVRGALAAQPVRLPSPEGADGEAIAFSLDGSSLYVVNEGVEPTLWVIGCASFHDDGASATDCLVDTGTTSKGCGCGGGASGGADSSAILVAGLGLARAVRRRRIAAGGGGTASGTRTA